MTTSKAVTYREASRHLLTQAHNELEAGDLRQASEKGWGAAAQMVKAAAQRRGWDHDSHRGLFFTVRDLSRESGDPEIHRLFISANGLHTNFYEDAFEADMVSEYLSDVQRFIAKLETLLDN